MLSHVDDSSVSLESAIEKPIVFFFKSSIIQLNQLARNNKSHLILTSIRWKKSHYIFQFTESWQFLNHQLQLKRHFRPNKVHNTWSIVSK